MIARSLTFRLLKALVAVQVGAIMLAMVAFPLLAPYATFDELAEQGFRTRIEAAITRLPSGALAIGNSPALAAYRASRPGTRFAVRAMDSGAIVLGSDPALAARLIQLGPLVPRPMANLIADLAPGGTLIVATDMTHWGRLTVATTGNRFRLEDWSSLSTAFAPVILPIYGPVLFGALILIPLVVALVTRRVRRLAADAAMVSADNLDTRLAESGLGPELQALARAVNAALDRIAHGMNRQRLYAANAAHELRTPVAILALHVDQLPAIPARARLQSDVARIRTLVEQLVTVARLGQNHVSMDEAIDLVALVRDVIADRAPLAVRERRDVALTTAAPHHFPILGNQQALFSALANIIDNAIRAEPAGGTVQVTLTATGLVSVSDHGAGIAPADRALVFEPFWRGGPGSGAGLGLAIVREIAYRHGIAVSVRETSGGGATFDLAFRRVAQSGVRASG